MNLSFTPDQQSVYNQYKGFGEKLTYSDLTERDTREEFSKTLWTHIAGEGLHGLPVSEALGGKNYSALNTIIALEAFGNSCLDEGLSFAANAQLLSITVPVLNYGTENQKSTYLTQLVDGSAIAAHAATEEQGGSDVFSMQTVAVKEAGGYKLNGKKVYITNAPVADLLLVYAATDTDKGHLGGISAFLIPSSTEGINLSAPVSKMGLRTCLMGSIELNNVWVQQEAILGGLGGGTKLFQESMNWERIGMSAMMNGIIHRLLNVTIQFTKERDVFRHQSVCHILAQLKGRLDASKLLTYHAAQALDEQSAKLPEQAASANIMASQLYQDVASAAVQLHGGYGYVTGTVERSMRNATAATLYSGTTEALLNFVARWL